jgi:hypothetical protein
VFRRCRQPRAASRQVINYGIVYGMGPARACAARRLDGEAEPSASTSRICAASTSLGATVAMRARRAGDDGARPRRYLPGNAPIPACVSSPTRGLHADQGSAADLIKLAMLEVGVACSRQLRHRLQVRRAGAGGSA